MCYLNLLTMDNLSFGTLESPSIYSSSTKTESSTKSGASESKHKEIDLTKDNGNLKKCCKIHT